jgi:hypothetical protein
MQAEFVRRDILSYLLQMSWSARQNPLLRQPQRKRRFVCRWKSDAAAEADASATSFVGGSHSRPGKPRDRRAQPVGHEEDRAAFAEVVVHAFLQGGFPGVDNLMMADDLVGLHRRWAGWQGAGRRQSRDGGEHAMPGAADPTGSRADDSRASA